MRTGGNLFFTPVVLVTASITGSVAYLGSNFNEEAELEPWTESTHQNDAHEFVSYTVCCACA
jgi:hypothetical protein